MSKDAINEATSKSALRLWLKAAAIVAAVVLLLAALWLLLPDIAAFGLRFEPARASAKTVLEWLGPRATGAVFRNYRHWEDEDEWRDLVLENMRLAEPNPNLRAQLVRSFRDLNCRSWRDWTPLHYATSLGYFEIAVLLASNGADLNAKEDFGRTPLHFTALGGQRKIAELLISNSADVNAKDAAGGTPLHEVALNGNRDIVEILVSKRADVNARALKDSVDGFKAGDTPLDIALRKGRDEMAELLRQHGAKTSAQLDAENTPHTPAEQETLSPSASPPVAAEEAVADQQEAP